MITPIQFDGATFDATLDGQRLERLQDRVFALMRDGRWRTLGEIQAVCGGTEASVSARLRDCRKTRNGAHTVERRRVIGGLWEYRLQLRDEPLIVPEHFRVTE